MSTRLDRSLGRSKESIPQWTCTNVEGLVCIWRNDMQKTRLAGNPQSRRDTLCEENETMCRNFSFRSEARGKRESLELNRGKDSALASTMDERVMYP